MATRSRSAELRRQAALAQLRDALLATDRAALAARDPIAEVRCLPHAEWEVAAHLVGAFCYGAVPQIRKTARHLFDAMDGAPTQFVRAMRRGELRDRLGDFRYRMTAADDLDRLAFSLGSLHRSHGSLEAAFVATGGEGEIIARLGGYVEAIRGCSPEPLSRGFAYLTPHPASGSAIKRWLLLLRWLVRPDDGADLGLWRAVDCAELIIPLDTHTSRLSRALGLTSRTTVDLQMAREVTAQLATVAPLDPVALDMPLCHLGIARDCLHRYAESICEGCALRPLCGWAAAKPSRANRKK